MTREKRWSVAPVSRHAGLHVREVASRPLWRRAVKDLGTLGPTDSGWAWSGPHAFPRLPQGARAGSWAPTERLERRAVGIAWGVR